MIMAFWLEQRKSLGSFVSLSNEHLVFFQRTHHEKCHRFDTDFSSLFLITL